jgi:hypothetical protein
MSALSDYAENKVLDVLGANATFTAPSAVYLGLSTGSFNDDGSGTEISGNNYARVAVSFGSAASGTMSNDAAIEFAAATGSGFGTVSHWGLFDAASSGNLLVHGSFSASKAIASGDVLKIAVGDLDITAA